jgi:hypothetical protein
MRLSITLILLLLLTGCAAVREAETHATQQARLDLQRAPLGRLNQQGAYARYGQASRVIRLPNDHIGWVYTVNDQRFAERTYTLEFTDDGLLHDIFYTSYSAQKVSARDVQDLSSETRD